MRTYLLTGKFIYPGPEIVAMDPSQCLGEDTCGRCITACLFGVNTSTGGIPAINYPGCRGCGRCVRTCKGKARLMTRRVPYNHEDIVPSELLL